MPGSNQLLSNQLLSSQAERPDAAEVNFFNLPERLDGHQYPPFSIIVGDRLGNLVIKPHARTNGLRAIVLPAVKPAPANSARRRRRLTRLEMVYLAASLTDTAAREPPYKFLFRTLVIQDAAKTHPHVVQTRGQTFRLRARAREAIQGEAGVCARRRQPELDCIRDHLIGHKLATIDIRVSNLAKSRARMLSLSQEIPGGDVGNRQTSAQKLRLRSFSNTGRPEQHQAEGII
jgi:hypothetical protein